MHPSMILNHNTKSEEVEHQNEYSICLRRDIVYYSQGKRQNLLKYSILGGPNQEYYQRLIQKTQKELEKIKCQQNELVEKMYRSSEQIDKRCTKKHQIQKQVISQKHDGNKLSYQLKKIQDLQENGENKMIKQIMIIRINHNKSRIQALQQSKKRVEDMIEINPQKNKTSKDSISRIGQIFSETLSQQKDKPIIQNAQNDLKKFIFHILINRCSQKTQCGKWFIQDRKYLNLNKPLKQQG